MIVWLPLADGVKSTEHVPLLSVQLAPGLLKLPAALLPNDTVPVGVIAVPADVLSLTVAVQVVVLPVFRVLSEHVTLVALARLFTVTFPEPLLLANWIGKVSPAYVALTVWVPLPSAVGV